MATAGGPIAQETQPGAAWSVCTRVCVCVCVCARVRACAGAGQLAFLEQTHGRMEGGDGRTEAAELAGSIPHPIHSLNKLQAG